MHKFRKTATIVEDFFNLTHINCTPNAYTKMDGSKTDIFPSLHITKTRVSRRCIH